MEDPHRLSFGEFLQDVRGVIASPGRRFSVIHERGALWGSLFLLLAPSYFGLSHLGGVYFEREPFPGYVFLVPAAAAFLTSFAKIYSIHIVARLFEGKGRYFAATGRLRDLFAVIGYTGVPAIIALCLGLLLFFLLPGQLGYLLRNFHVVVVSILIAIGIGLFIWNLILSVLALRNVYPMRDFKIFIAVILGPALLLPAVISLHQLVGQAEVDTAYLAPELNTQMMRLFAVDPSSPESRPSRIDVYVDRLAYRYRQPARFDFAVFDPVQELPGKEGKKQGGVIIGDTGASAGEKKIRAAGRILGLPGERVEMVQGKLSIDGRPWHEPYVASEWRSSSSFPARTLGAAEYLVLPSDRRLLAAGYSDIIVSRERVVGRMVANKWPLMWLFYRPTVFMKGYPEFEARAR